jgi:Tfp pilus assembly protein PilP
MTATLPRAAETGKIELLLKVKVYEPFTYEALIARSLQAEKADRGVRNSQTSTARKSRSRPFSGNPEMVGRLARVVHAVIRTPDNTVYHVMKGNYGQNLGPTRRSVTVR